MAHSAPGPTASQAPPSHKEHTEGSMLRCNHSLDSSNGGEVSSVANAHSNPEGVPVSVPWSRGSQLVQELGGDWRGRKSQL